MSFTNSTPNYGLPQWIAADHPKYLTDINNAFSTIDTQIKNANDTANTADDNATSALSIASQAATTAESAATVAGQAAALAQSVNELVGTLNAKMGTTSIATIGDGTVTGAISSINNYVKDLIKNDLSSNVDIKSYVSDYYTFTSDGYVNIFASSSEDVIFYLYGADSTNEIISVLVTQSGRQASFVKKGMRFKISTSAVDLAKFVPLS